MPTPKTFARLFALAVVIAASLDPTFAPNVNAGAASDQEDGSHFVLLADIARESPGSARVPTHVVLEGRVELNRKEHDGDRHIRICAGGLCVVAECIPEMPEIAKECGKVRKGDVVWVTGITRYDGRHGWWEVHPVTQIETK